MPTRAPRICGCGKTVPSGAVCSCVEQRKAQHDDTRLSAAKRGYDAAWKKVRLQFLQAHPLCIECERLGKIEPATDVDHIQSIAERPDLRLSWSNLRPFCHPHHSQHTAREQGFARRGRGVVSNFGPGGEDRYGSSPREKAEIGFSQSRQWFAP